MKKYLFVIARYNDVRQNWFDEKISPRNREYCERHGFKYIEVRGEHQVESFRNNPTWWKFTIVRDAIRANKIVDGDIVTHLDADMYIVKPECEYRTNKSFSYSIDNGNTHCMGNYTIQVNEWSRALLDNILSEERYQKLKDVESLHIAFNEYSSFWSHFREQASWYSLAGIKRHSWEPFLKMPNFGFHSDKTKDTLYTLEELHKHVEVRPASWNVTHDYESTDRFNINKVEDKDVIIRHFAGGQYWDVEKWTKI
ncbi:MAG: hypothetical protein EBU90_03350 [Proteobacteria bacterium]|nr:hypothetical protein [Pseudomonadota bacterium]NBP13363.1 hypothetical protein [bacterium]